MDAPNFVILLVDDPQRSAAFYRRLLGIEPVESSPTFALFAPEGGVRVGLWSRHTVEPSATASPGAAEIVFRVDAPPAVDATHRDWAGRGLEILQEPADMDFGRTFVAADPDGHRLRVYWLDEAS